jgi:hypothetical protein
MTSKGTRTAMFAVTCAICANRIGTGESIADAGGPWGHRDCVEFNRNKLLVESNEDVSRARRPQRGGSGGLYSTLDTSNSASGLRDAHSSRAPHTAGVRPIVHECRHGEHL